MSLHLRQLSLDIRTNRGLYGVNIPFEDGLVILRADNTSGKSTCVQSIMYALGLERMLTSKNIVPLPPVMTSRLVDDGEEINVLESDVFLEISNGNGDVITIKRAVKTEHDTRLISVFYGPALSNKKGDYEKHDFYVRDPGAAKNEMGFHRYLESFLGWDLPTVRTYDGKEVQLYIECIFPLLIVEQKVGWSGIQSNMPTYKIKEVGKRSIEYLAKLDAYNVSIKKQELVEEKKILKNEWDSQISVCNNLLLPINGTIQSLPSSPVSSWPPKIVPYIGVYQDEKQLPIRRAIKEDKVLLSHLKSEETPTVRQAEPLLVKELEDTRNLLEEKEVVLRSIFEEVNLEKNQHQEVEIRLSALKEDLRRNNDIKKIRKYGSDENLVTTHETCPVCHQKTPDYLIADESFDEPMSVDENIKFIKSQIEIFSKMKESNYEVIKVKNNQLFSIRNEVNDIRAHIRALKQTLTSSEDTPSISTLRKMVLLEEKIDLQMRILEEFEFNLSKFEDLAFIWNSLLEREKHLPDGTLSNSDRKKLKLLEKSFNHQLDAYGFSSFSKSIEISHDTYKPTLEAFDLKVDVSASDFIRIIWAYLSGLLEVSRDFATNHPGLLIFDEPRQQDASQISYNNLLRRSSKAKEYNQQIIFATSEEREKLEAALEGYDYQYHDFEGKIIKKLN
ncbi:AAA family ATPase [Methanococcoides sp. AM1]|uniref:AAA family ATPase n=1 Tax=Methanococcoides sp. AM1 TaxID=1201011 RepID=UPI001082F7B0|nr:AAA family ATPase [Methanococcoides sp. AM1]